ncbi:switch 2 [Podospora australis]|uniref:Switch 2 n=1 Tax=Podospora australis TaxID=1536484 RepID=A0AAN7AN25_9PEZI|nr:switch 2 [Podospora australis]
MTRYHVERPDDESTASSEAEESRDNLTILGKRKQSPELKEKVEWTDDDSDDATKRNPPKRRATAGTKRGRPRGSGRSRASGRGGRKNVATAKRSLGRGRATSDSENEENFIKHEYPEADIPDYLHKRRKAFNKGRELLKDGGLRLPPDYSDLYFSDDERLSRRGFPLAERPQFDEKSGIKPCRPYKEIELEYSAGIIPAPIAQYLRDYQIAGVKFLHQRFVYQKGCILGDDMGLGKTVQVAAFLAAAFGKTGDERDGKRMRKMRRAGEQWYPSVLIVCPGSLIQNWKNELNRWGWWHVDIYHGSEREAVLNAAKSGRLEIMITTYVTYKNSCEAVNEVEWDCVVADECHVLKDRRSETTQRMDRVNSLCRIGLTGTAIQNKYEELWTLLNWTNPGHFATLPEWNNTITKPLVVGQSHDATLKQLSVARTTAKKLVSNLLPEFFLRRMKTLIAHQLPKKTDKVVFCPLTDIQRGAYENFLDGDHVTWIKTISDPCDCGSKRKRGWCCYTNLPEDGRSWKSLVFPTIITLQKIANHMTLLIPSTSDTSDKQGSELDALRTCLPDSWEDLYRNRDNMLNLANPEFCGKWKILKKLLRFWHENGDKVLVFSHSVRLLRVLQHLFHNTSYNVSFLDGSLSYEDRQQVVDDFNSDPAQFVFLISTKAGGVGLNITSANKVVIFDPHWNPAYDLQAQDRAYRIGQVRDVDVFRLISAGTIEEIVYARQIYKQQQANIGYNASNERRYFKGVQQDSKRKGEIFGLNNLFSFHADHVVLRDIVNKTNVAEAKAGVHLTDIDLEKIAEDEDDELSIIKQEDDAEDGGASQLAKFITAENKEDLLNSRKAKKPQSDAISAILASAGVEYTHENSEVIGTSRVEAQLSRRAELAANTDSQDLEGNSALFADSQANNVPDSYDAPWRMHFKFNPPASVMKRQFCSMAKEFGFSNATDFALVVESWTQEQRRNCLDTFYRSREVKLLEEELDRLKKEEMEVEAQAKSLGMEFEEITPDEERSSVVSHQKPLSEKTVQGSVVTVGTNTDDNDVSVKMEMSPPPPQPTPTPDPDPKIEPAVQIKTETAERRISTIFLSDDDEDDEL